MEIPHGYTRNIHMGIQRKCLDAMIYSASVFSQKVVTRHNCVSSKQPIKRLN